LPTTPQKLQEALREIGISADNPQDFFLYDYRSPQERPIKEVRRPRASIRRQLSETKQAAAPKKAPARTKKNELEV